VRIGLALFVFLLDVTALVSIFAMPVRFGRKLAWSAAVVLLPSAGALAWLLTGRGRTRTVATRHE
jgi:hypothetical protein